MWPGAAAFFKTPPRSPGGFTLGHGLPPHLRASSRRSGARSVRPTSLTSKCSLVLPAVAPA